MRNKKLAWNTISGLLYQGTAVICGFILPRAILNCYGSEVNGLVNSIAQFLQMITFLELGVGAVVQSALYKPLADRADRAISQVIASGSSFFRKLAGILILYVAALVVVYPKMVNDDFGFAYDATLILAMSISYFAQYYFGIIDGLLLKADQKAYISNIIDTVTVLLNTFFCYCLVYWGFSIQVVKVTTAGIFLLRPILVRLYIRKHYKIDRKCSYTKDPVDQKWNGIAQHVAAIVRDSTDMAVLSVFATMADVSVYSVYYLVVSGIKNLILSCFNGITALFGELWAKQEWEELNKYYSYVEWFFQAVIVFVWCCTYRLIVPFVMVYTKNVTDANYNVPVFAALLCVAYMIYCYRLPFNTMILSAGHYRNTQGIYIVSAVINLVLSVFAVRRWGLIGVTIGSMSAMLYQLLFMAYYVIKKLQVYSVRQLAKQVVFDLMTIMFALYATSIFPAVSSSWVEWIVLAVKNAVVIGVCVVTMNVVFYNKQSVQMLKKVFARKN